MNGTDRLTPDGVTDHALRCIGAYWRTASKIQQQKLLTVMLTRTQKASRPRSAIGTRTEILSLRTTKDQEQANDNFDTCFSFSIVPWTLSFDPQNTAYTPTRHKHNSPSTFESCAVQFNTVRLDLMRPKTCIGFFLADPTRSTDLRIGPRRRQIITTCNVTVYVIIRKETPSRESNASSPWRPYRL